MFEEMGSARVRPNDVTLVSVLSACGNLGTLGLGKRIHGFLDENGYGLNLFVGSALIDMYCICGVVMVLVLVLVLEPPHLLPLFFLVFPCTNPINSEATTTVLLAIKPITIPAIPLEPSPELPLQLPKGAPQRLGLFP
ncbi:hypothetical protein MRB53_016394 [Persea americana]|uniref:Uncharacterized protein n=1 Tax=Persea americana TaxID=3435 RepID=A0ACC2M218_PERAE|nr:hypothetical protein MRB53_016394 [Persea americana]